MEMNEYTGRKEMGTHSGTGQSADTGKRVLMLASVASMIDQFNMPNIKLLQEMGCEVHVACNFRKGNTCDAAQTRRLARRLDGMGVRFYQWDCPRNVYAAGMCMKAFMQLWRLTGIHKYDMIHCHSPAGGALARIVAHYRRIPVIYTAHGFHFYRGAPIHNWLLYYPAEKLLAYWTDVLITVNQEDYAFAKRNLAAGRTYRIPGVGIDTARFSGGSAEPVRRAFREKYRIPQDAVLLLSVGELSARKNHRVVLDALASLQRGDVYYLICGQGELRERLLRHAEELGIGRQVRMAGFVNRIEEAYRAADIFVFPSLQEGLPVALAEAMAAGLPCVSSDIRGNRELAAGRQSFPAGDAGALARLLREFAEDEKLREDCGRRNRERSRNYGRTAAGAVMRRIYQSECGGRTACSRKF